MATYTPSPTQTIALLIGVLVALLAAPIHAATFSGSNSDRADISPGDGVCKTDTGALVSCTLRATSRRRTLLPHGMSLSY
jgi:hypothetical protein